jgi:hypothetical protein
VELLGGAMSAAPRVGKTFAVERLLDVTCGGFDTETNRGGAVIDGSPAECCERCCADDPEACAPRHLLELNGNE